jgi:mono/diheme cytochrome c family protein
MRRILAWIGIGVGTAVALVAFVILGLFAWGAIKASERLEISVQPPAIPSDRRSIERGRHIAEAVALCTGCHQNGLRGQNLDLPSLLAKLSAPNLTAGEGGVGGEYTVADWDRAIRHGVARDGRKLILMPSEFYAQMTDSDFAALVAYLRTLTPIDNTLSGRTIGVVGGALIGAGRFPLAADVVKHEEVGQHTVVREVSEEYGSYLATLGNCRTCHGPELRGRTSRIGPPPGPSLVDSTRNWSADDFRKTIRTGRTPGGRPLDPQQMPWPRIANLTDDELNAVWEYVRSIAPY